MAAMEDSWTKEGAILGLHRQIDEDNEKGYIKILREILHDSRSQIDMVEMATTTSKNGKSLRDRTLSHLNSFFLQVLIHSCFCWSIVSNKIVEMKEFLKETLDCATGGMPQTIKFMQWAQRHIEVDGKTNKCKYMMFKQPSILIVPYTENRPGADKETAALESCLQKLGLTYTLKPDLPLSKLPQEIREAQDSGFGQSGQMVFIMGHGIQGNIFDNERRLVPIHQIHLTMCPRSHIGTPKILVVQACQNVPSDMERASNVVFFRDNSQEDADDGEGMPNTEPVTSNLYKEDFYLICSASPGEPCERNKFIPLLAEALVTNKHKCIRDAFMEANGKLMQKTGAIACPRDTLRASLVLAEIYDI